MEMHMLLNVVEQRSLLIAMNVKVSFVFLQNLLIKTIPSRLYDIGSQLQGWRILPPSTVCGLCMFSLLIMRFPLAYNDMQLS